MLQLKDTEHYVIYSDGRIWSKRRHRFMTPVNNSLGYLSVVFWPEKERHYVHRLVAKSFLSNGDGLPFVNHKDSNPSNNGVDNLEWCTHQQNVTHAQSKGRLDRKLSYGRKLIMAEMYRSGAYNTVELANVFGVTKTRVSQLRHLCA
jgi:hypothetical protein